MKRFIADV